MLKIEWPKPDDGPVSRASRYTLRGARYGSPPATLDGLGAGRGRRLLDVGTADGLLSRRLTERGWKVTGLEADPAAAAAGAAHCERMIVADLEGGVPPLEGEFDAIVCADVLEHLRDPAAALAAMRHALAPDGEVVISIPNVAHLWVRLSLLAGHFDYTERGIFDRTHLRFFTRRTLAALVTGAGLRAARLSTTAPPTPRWTSRDSSGWRSSSTIATTATAPTRRPATPKRCAPAPTSWSWSIPTTSMIRRWCRRSSSPSRAARPTSCWARGSRAARRSRRGCRGGSSSPTASSRGSRTARSGCGCRSTTRVTAHSAARCWRR